MKHLLRYITAAASSAFVLASLLNSQLIWDKDQFYSDPTETVKIDQDVYTINTEYNDVLRDRATDKVKKVYSQEHHEASIKVLSKFFRLVR